MNVRASVDSTATTVGGRVLLTLEVEGADGLQLGPPRADADVAPFLLRGAALREGAALPTLDVVLVATSPGEVSIPSIAIPARTSAGAETTLTSPPVALVVTSNLAPEEVAADSTAAAAALAGYKPALEAPRDWRPVGIALAALLVAAVAGFFLLRKLRAMRRRPAPAAPAPRIPKKPVRPAWDIALEELDRIARAGYVARGELRAQSVETADVLRRYIENRWGVPALESTTEELRAPLGRIAISGEVRARIFALLAEADLVKFAKATPEPAAAEALVERVREIVETTTPRAAVAPPPLPEAPSAPRPPTPGASLPSAGAGGAR